VAYTEVLKPQTYVNDPGGLDFQLYCPGCGYTGCRANTMPAQAVLAMTYNDSPWSVPGQIPEINCLCGRHTYVGPIDYGCGRFTLTDPAINGEIASAILRIAWNNWGFAPSLLHRIWTHGNLYTVGPIHEELLSEYPPDLPWKVRGYGWTTNPFTGLPWTLDELRDLEAGFVIDSAYLQPYVDQLYVLVTYSKVPPVVATQAATDVQPESARLNGQLTDDGGEACTLFFEWGDNPSLGNTAPAGTGSTGASFSALISGLLTGQNYYFRAGATNSRGTTYGAILSLTSSGGGGEAVTVMTLAAIEVAESSGKLRGFVQNSLGRYGDVRFEWGGTAAYGNATPWRSGYHTGDTFEERLTNLSEGAVYHFRAQFRDITIVSGSDQSFSTLSAQGPVTFADEETMMRLEEVP
jgi:hypothetical protein